VRRKKEEKRDVSPRFSQPKDALWGSQLCLTLLERVAGRGSAAEGGAGTWRGCGAEAEAHPSAPTSRPGLGDLRVLPGDSARVAWRAALPARLSWEGLSPQARMRMQF